LTRFFSVVLTVLTAALALPGIGGTTAFANNPGDPLFCQPQEGVGYLITNSGSDVWTVDSDCFANFNPGVPATLTSQATITTTQGGTLTLTVTPSGGNYVYTPPTASFVGVDSFSFTVTTEWNSAGGTGSGPGNTTSHGGPFTFTGSSAIQLNVLNATDSMTGLKNTTVAVPLPASSIAGPCTVGNLVVGPAAGAITGCVTAVSNLPPSGFPLSLEPSHGTLSRTGSTGLSYTPTAGYYGLDTFNAFALGANTDGPTALSSGQITYTVAVMTTVDTLQPSYNASQLSTFLLPAFSGGTLLLDQPGATYSQAFTLDNSATNAIDQGGNAATFSGVLSGGNLTIANSGVGGSVTFTAANTYTGTTTINSGAKLNLAGAGSIATSSGLTDNGTFDISATTSGASIKSLAGGGAVTLGNQVLTLTNANDTFAGTIAGNGGLTLAGGVEVLTGTNTYLGPTTINSGATLVVNGSITDPTVNSGGLLTGTGAVGSTTVNNGGVLAPGSTTPGTSLTINGSLAFASGALYVVTLNSTATTSANVVGSAALGGTVQAVLSPGTVSLRKQYDILHSAGLGGTAFAGAALTNSPNFAASLSYSPTDVFLNIAANLGAGAGLNTNQRNVANAINNSFNSSGALPPGFVNLFSLSGNALGGALSQVSGEIGSSAQQTTFQAMSQFMNLLTDPYMGRGAGIDGSNSATAPTPYMEESGASNAYAQRKPLAAERDAYAMFTKAPLANVYQPRWSVWASGFGGTQTTTGNTRVGSNDMRSSVFGSAAGADYLLSPNTLAGFALAGGGTSFALGNGLGSGRSDLFQAGAYLRHSRGAAYVSAAAGYGWQDITTDRVVTVAGFDHLRAQFNANTWSGRLEGGYRFVAPFAGGFGITPYGGAQVTTFDLPNYMEQAIVGSNQFALGYGAKAVTDARGELGVRTDKSYAVQNGILTLRGRFAWAHDFDPDRNFAATFQSLPGASFVVNGARQAPDSALTTLAAEWRWINHWSAAATFEGEFSGVTQSYAGKGVVRYTW
jgi:uncharacterized protein with beta-barrel porin domain